MTSEGDDDIENFYNHEPVTFGEWRHPIFGCMEHPPSFFLALCCPCCSLGRTMHRLGIKQYQVVVSIVFVLVMIDITVSSIVGGMLGMGISVIMSFVLGVYVYTDREMLRERLGIPRHPDGMDPIDSICCVYCALAQMANQAGLVDFSFAIPLVADLSDGDTSLSTKKKQRGTAQQSQPYMESPYAGTYDDTCTHPSIAAAARANGGKMPRFCPDCGITLAK